MSRSDETLYRQWVMLSHIPRFPRKITVPQLEHKLMGEGYTVNARTIQRDLHKLSVPFPLDTDSSGRKHYWFWIESAIIQDLPGMDPVTALAFEMAESFLKPLLPQATLVLLQPYFDRAKSVLNDQSSSILRSWPDKIDVIERGPVLLKPTVLPEVQQVIYQALLEEKALFARYQSRNSTSPKDYLLHPLGIVSRMGILYLVCTKDKQDKIRHFSLHRFVSAQPSDTTYRANKGFVLHDYTNVQQKFSYPMAKNPINLKVLFEKNIAKHLQETPLSNNQTLKTQEDGRVLLEASVMETLELIWWLQGFGDNIEVVKPLKLRKKFKLVAESLFYTYKD